MPAVPPSRPSTSQSAVSAISLCLVFSHAVSSFSKLEPTLLLERIGHNGASLVLLASNIYASCVCH